MTSNKHISGTDRCLEVIEKIDENYDVVVNVQGDEPFIHPSQINQLIDAFDNASTQIATLAKIIKNKSVILDQHTTKVKFDDDFWATSFDRLLPVKKETSYYKHIGLYAYRTEILKEISKLAATEKECQLRLEQWRWLDHCYSIKIQLTSHDAFSIDTPEDLKKVIQRFG